MSVSKQLTLPLSWAFSKNIEDFIVNDCNRYAFEWLEKWPFKIQDNFVCLVGDKGSGKTHLSNIWASRLNGDVIHSSSDMFSKWYDMSSPDSSQKYFVLDDVDQLKDDILLFYIYNTIKEKDAFLLMTAKEPPSKWGLSLNDIKSRISTINVINIEKPNDQAISSIIEKMLLQRGITVKDNVIEYIANRIDRSYESINYWVNQIDIKLTEKSKVSFSTIKSILC